MRVSFLRGQFCGNITVPCPPAARPAGAGKFCDGGIFVKKIWSSYKSSFILLGCMVLGGIVGAFWGPGASVLTPWANIF